MTSPSSPDAPFPSRRKLGELLVTAKLISPEQRNKALEEARKKHMRLGQYLVLQKVIKEIHLAKAISFQLKVEMFNPKRHLPDEGVRELVTEQFAFENKLCPVFRKGEVLYVAMLDPTDMHAIDEIVFNTHLDVEPLICTRAHVTELHKQIYGIGVAAPLDDTLVLRDEIDLDAVQAPGAHASAQAESGQASPGAGRAPAPSSDPAAQWQESSTLAPLDLDAMALSAGESGMPSLDLGAEGDVPSGGPFVPGEELDMGDHLEEMDVLPYVEAVEAVPGVEVVQTGDIMEAETEPADANGDALLCLNDRPLARRIEAVQADKYEREEVVRAALMLGLAVLEEEPGLVAALNMRSRDPWA